MSPVVPSEAPTHATPEPERSRGHRWARLAAWTVGGLLFLVLLMIGTGAILLHNARFHDYLLKLAEKKAAAALGVPVQIQNFALHLSNLSVDVYGVTVHGAEPYRDPPILLMQHAEAGIRIVSVWSRKWYLDTVRIDRPVVRLIFGPDGTSNLPKLKSSGGGSQTDVFALGVRHAVLDKGEIYYNNKKSDLEADVHDVDFQSTFDDLLQKYSGTLSYRDGHLEANGLRPVTHNLDAQFNATRDTFHLTEAKLTSGASQFVLSGTVKNYSHPDVEAQYHAVLDGSDARRILQNPSIPTGVVLTSGTMKYVYDSNRPVLDSVVLQGKLNSRQLRLQASDIRARVNDLAGQYSLANGNVSVQNLRARLLGGTLTANLEMRDVTGSSQSRLNANLHGISLPELKRTASSSPAIQHVALTGSMNAKATAEWNKSPNSMVAHADATLHAGISHRVNPLASGDTIPVNGVVHATYRAAKKQFAVMNSYLRMPQTNVALNGTVGNRSGLKVQLASHDLQELETVADLFRTPKPGEPVPSFGLAGTATFDGIIRGSASAPDLTGQLIASNLQVKGTRWRVLRTNVEISPSVASLQHGELASMKNARITFNARTQLRKWSFTKTSPMQVELHASSVDIATLQRIAGLNVPVTGTLAANVTAHGTVLDPNGEGTVTLKGASVYQQPIDSAKLTFTGAGGQINGKLALAAASGALEATASFRPEQKSYIADVRVKGLQLGDLQALKARDLDVNGILGMRGHGSGTLENPQFDATLQIPQLAVQGQLISGTKLQMDMANHVADANLDSSFAGNALKATAKLQLSGNYYVEAKLDSHLIQLQSLLAMYAPSEVEGVQGETELHATLRGPLKDRKLLEGHATVPILKLDYGKAVHLAAASPIHIDYKNRVVDLQQVAIRGTDTDLQIKGSIPTVRNAHLSLLLVGTVDLKLARLFNPDVRSSGQLRFNINSYDTRPDSNVEGRVEIINANYSNGTLPIGLQRGNGVLTLTKDRVSIESFKATVGGGTLTAQGGVVYRPAIQFDLGATAKGIRMLYPEGVREDLDADLHLSGNMESAQLGGRVRLQDLSFTPNFDLMNFIGNLSSGVAPPPSRGFSQNLQLNLAVSSVNNLNLVSRTLSIDGTANLQVRGTAADPVILGRINLNDGDLIFNGTRYTLGGGTVQFVNPAQTEPVVNLAVNTTIQQYNIHLRFTGPVDQLHTNYASDPSLPAADIINLLAFGQTTEAGVANPTPGNQAAMGVVASQVSSQITSRVAKIAGISQLSINPVLSGGSAQGPAGAIVTIQQRVTGNLFVTFSTNVTSTQSQVIMGQYRISPRLSVSATRDQNGGFGFDVLLKKKW